MPDETIQTPDGSATRDQLLEPGDSTIQITDKINIWKRRISAAQKVREKELKDVNKLIGFYEGHQWWNEDVPVLEDRTTINLIFANIKAELPYLYFQNPNPIVNARRPEFELNAFASQELLKYYTKENLDVHLKKQIRLCILDSKFAGFGVAKVLYSPTYESNIDAGKPILLGHDELGDPIYLSDNEGNLIGQDKDILISELFFVERVAPTDILIDPECKNFPEKAKWIAQQIIKPLDYIKNNPIYKNTEDLGPNINLKEILRGVTAEVIRDTDEQRVQFYEIFDLENNQILVLVDGGIKFIREDNFTVNPFAFLKFNEIPDKFYAIPDVRVEKPLQEDVNVGQSQMLNHARRASRKYYYEENTIDEEQVTVMKNPEDMTVFIIKDINKPPKALEMAPQDPSIFQSTMLSKQNFNEITAGSDASRGQSERRKTGGEARIIEGHSAVRRTDKRSLVADFIKEIYSKLLQLMQDTLTIPQAIKIVGPVGTFWTKIGKNEITGELTVDIEVSDLQPQIPEVERKELQEFMFALANLLNAIVANPLMLQVINIQGMIKELIKSYPYIKAENIMNMAVSPEQIAKLAMQQQQQQGGKNNQNTQT